MAHEHSHGDHHEHGGIGHSHAPKDFGVAFAVGVALNSALVIAEIGFGIFSNSLALIADGVHNFSDVIGLLLAWGGVWAARLKPTESRTYGYRRASILAAIANATLLVAVTGGIIVEAVRRFFEAQSVASITVIWVASLGILVNTGTALMFMSGRKSDLNIRGAFLHMAGDAAVSVGVVLAAILVSFTGWLWLDPLASLGIGFVILATSWSLTRDSVNLAMDAVPRNIDRAEVEKFLGNLPGVIEIHDLHIWAMSTTETALTAHLVRPKAGLDDVMLANACQELNHRFQIHHATLQVESGEAGIRCVLAPIDVI